MFSNYQVEVSKKLEALEAVSKAATEAPWVRDDDAGVIEHRIYVDGLPSGYFVSPIVEYASVRPSDLEFILTARNNFQFLLDAVTATRNIHGSTACEICGETAEESAGDELHTCEHSCRICDEPYPCQTAETLDFHLGRTFNG